MIEYIIFLGIAVFFYHEAGHYLGFLMLGKKPTVEMRGLNFMIGANVIGELKGREAFLVSFIGMITGLFPLIAAQGLLPYFVIALMTLLYMTGLYYDFKVLGRAIGCWDSKFRGD